MFHTNEPTFLMCPPDLYDVNYVINPWMSGNLHLASRETAAAQWSALHTELSRVARVLLLKPEPGWPDMVFTANAGLVHDGIATISNFTHSERQGEEPFFREWFRNAGFIVSELPRSAPFEGEGDALFEPGITPARLWVGHGLRTSPASHRLLRSIYDAEVISLHLIDPRFYHLDTCFCPLTNGFVLYYPDAFDAPSRARIEARYNPAKRIIVSEADALCFACNAINVGQTVIMNQVSPALCDNLRSVGFQPVTVPLSEFLRAGGAAKCLVLRLSEMDVTHTPATDRIPATPDDTLGYPQSQSCLRSSISSTST